MTVFYELLEDCFDNIEDIYIKKNNFNKDDIIKDLIILKEKIINIYKKDNEEFKDLQSNILDNILIKNFKEVDNELLIVR